MHVHIHKCVGGGAVPLPALGCGAGQDALHFHCLLHWHGSLVRDSQVSFWLCIRSLLAMYQVSFGYVLGLFWLCIGLFWICIRSLLDMYWVSLDTFPHLRYAVSVPKVSFACTKKGSFAP